MQYSPKLKLAMEEIKQVLKKYDIGACVMLHTHGFMEYLNHIDPSYSAISQPVQGGFRIKADSRTIGKERADELAHGTADLMLAYRKHSGMMKEVSDGILHALSGSYDITDNSGNHSGHNQQNN